MKYLFAALVIHAAVLCVPVAHKATEAAKQRVIDVVVMRQEAPPPAPLPKVEKKPEARKPEPPKVNEPEKSARPVAPQKTIEKEQERPAGGGNVLDEKIVSQVTTGPATGGSEGVGIAGANVAGGKIGPGGGGSGTGTAQATGPSASPTGPAAPSGPIDMRLGEVGAPQFLKREVPEYPLIAQKMRREGRVVVRATIDEKGKLTKTEVVEATDEFFKQAALEAVKNSTYLAGRRNGAAVATRVDIPYKFSLRQ